MSEPLYTRVDWGVLDAEGQVKRSGLWDNTTWRESDATEECKALNDDPEVPAQYKPLRPVMLVYEDEKPPARNVFIQYGVLTDKGLRFCTSAEVASATAHLETLGTHKSAYPVKLIIQEIEP